MVVVRDRDGNRHRGGHRDRHGGRHGVDFLILVEVVDLEMGRVIDRNPRGRDRLGDRMINRLGNRDGNGGDLRTVELQNTIEGQIHRKRAYNVQRKEGKRNKPYLRNVQLMRHLIG